MKWITHQTGAIFGSLAIGLPLPGVVCASLGAVFPDLIDQRASKLAASPKNRQKLFNRIHRGSSHWFGWWLLLFLSALALPLPLLCRDALAGFVLGALSHVCMDALTPFGVPLLPFTRKGRIAMPICSTGKAGEYIFLGLMMALGLVWLRESWRPMLLNMADYFRAISQ